MLSFIFALWISCSSIVSLFWWNFSFDVDKFSFLRVGHLLDKIISSFHFPCNENVIEPPKILLKHFRFHCDATRRKGQSQTSPSWIARSTWWFFFLINFLTTYENSAFMFWFFQSRSEQSLNVLSRQARELCDNFLVIFSFLWEHQENINHCL